jgi:cytochrome c2
MNKTSLTLFLLAAACLVFSFLPWPTAQTQNNAAPITAQNTEASPPDGASLFVAKGCVSCHRHEDFNREVMDIFWGDAPDLSNYQGTADFLRLWLKDPRAVRTDAQMPNLNLSEAEIEALITMLLP